MLDDLFLRDSPSAHEKQGHRLRVIAEDVKVFHACSSVVS